MFLVRAYIPGLIDGRLCRTFTERGALKEKFSSKPVSGPLATLSIVFSAGIHILLLTSIISMVRAM
jgi:hypothetical protein